jgi:hypothetical protein
MNRFKIICLFFVIGCGCSCTKSVDLTSKLQLSIINNTDKKIIKVITTDVGQDTLISSGNDNVSIIFIKRTSSESGFLGLGHSRAPLVEVIEEHLYCINDTSKFVFRIPYSNYLGIAEANADSIYAKNISFELDNKSTDSNPFIISKFIFNDTLFSILIKDYSMLTKFKQYYPN